jgi:3-oxoadipate enol-lactonase
LEEEMIKAGRIVLGIIFAVSLRSWGGAQPQTKQASQSEEGSFVQVEGSKLYYQECGTAPQTVVLVHDGVVDSRVWDEVWPEFCKRFHTIRYDQRGFGRSPAATTWYSETDDLAILLHHLRVTRTFLVGSSHGGGLAIDFTLTHPAMVQQLLLVGAVVSGMPYSQAFLDRGKHIFDLLDKGDVKEAISEWSKDKYLIGPGHDAARKHLFDLLTSDPHDMTHRDYSLPTKSALPQLHSIRVPTLVLVGDDDVTDVHVNAGAIEAGIPNARLIVVQGVGHLMYLEKPEEFTRLLISFIETNSD